MERAVTWLADLGQRVRALTGWRRYAVALALGRVLGAQQGFSHVIDGRFKGGYITRRYGRPADGLHAVQLEMTSRCYLDEADPAQWHGGRAAEVAPLLHALVQALIDWRP